MKPVSYSRVTIALISATLVTGIVVYYVLTYFLIPFNYTLPICILLSILSFGLTRYYSEQYERTDTNDTGNFEFGSSTSIESKENSDSYFSKIGIALIYSILIIVCASSNPRLDLVYASWNSIGLFNLFQLVAAIFLCFFMPGYALVTLVLGNYKINPILKVLAAYLSSILITALTIYTSSIWLESNIYENKFILLSIYSTVLFVFAIYCRLYRIILYYSNDMSSIFKHGILQISKKVKNTIRANQSEIIVFASLSSLIIISTYYLYEGTTIGDQWYHQNRAIFFIHGNFKDLIMTSGDQSYTPLLSALLGGLTSISGVPMVNGYASIALLNMTSVFAFYYFCQKWLPANTRRASLLAATLLVIASGFGWMYMLYLTSINPIESQENSISYFVENKLRVTDIRLSSNFMIGAFPDFSTGLTLVCLPAGFILLALIRVEFRNKINYTIIFSIVSLSGILFHDEFYIFILIALLLPLIYLQRNRAYVYFAILISLSVVFFINRMLPIEYFTFNSILGKSLIETGFIFTLVTLALYLLCQYWHKYFSFISIKSFRFRKMLARCMPKINLIQKVTIASVIIYLFAFCFLVWTQLPDKYVDAHTQNYNTPWYLYPMRLGIVGVIALASILSYIFKRFEKEVFVFGILIIVALVIGPYYNEHRLSKYVMVGCIGFASLFVFKLFNVLKYNRPLLNGVIIGSIVITASLSTLMYIGFNALVTETQDYNNALGRRNFPSSTEFDVLNLLRSNIQNISDESVFNNVASFPNEYSFREGNIISKLHAFSGLPLKNAIQTQYLLNASSLESFYHLLELSKTGYIMIPRGTVQQATLTDPTRFAFDNFQQIYLNDNYTVLAVPRLQGPSTNFQNKVGVLYEMDNSLASLVFNKKKLDFNETYDFENQSTKILQVKDNQTDRITLYGNKKNGGKALWTKDLDSQGYNYIGLSLRTLEETKKGNGVLGVKWNEGNRTYLVSFTSKGLHLGEQSTTDGKSMILSESSYLKNEHGRWHTFKIAILNRSINVFVDDLLRMNIPKDSYNASVGISNIGLYAENSTAQFESVRLGKMISSQEKYDIRNYNYYYSLTSLALSNIPYGSYTSDDESIFSNNLIILPFDSKYISDELFHHLLNYTKAGGTLIVINSDDMFEGRFSKLFSIQSINNYTEGFTRIASHKEQGVMLNVSGSLKSIELRGSTGSKILASYRNSDNQTVAPFALEKPIADKGRIIYVNGFGYFGAISTYPQKYFLSLKNLSDILGIEKSTMLSNKTVSEPIKRFVGDVVMNGNISIISPSVSLTSNTAGSANVYIKNISVLDKFGNLKNQLENVSVTDVKIFGNYQQIVKLDDRITLPTGDSHHDYVGIPVAKSFNMSLVPLDGTNNRVEITVDNNNSSINMIRLSNDSKIDFYGIRSASPTLKFVPILVKNPEIIVRGNVSFDKTNFYGQEIDDYFPLKVNGLVKVKFDLIDDFEEPYRNGTKINQLSYLDSIIIDGKINQFKSNIELPGEVSQELVKRGLDVPFLSILVSLTNFIIITVIVAASITAILLLRKNDFYRQGMFS